MFAQIVGLTAGIPIDKLRYIDTETKGVRAAGRVFPHSFSALGLVFERKVDGGQRVARKPIVRTKIDLEPEASDILNEKSEQTARQYLDNEFQRELARRLRNRRTR